MSLSFKDEFFEKLNKLDKGPFLRRTSNEAGIIAVKFTKERFRGKNWVDKQRNPWKPRKKKDKGSLLAKSGRLKRSIRKLSSGRFYVFIGTDVAYAQIHNEGGEINQSVNVRAHNRGNGRKRKVHRVRAHRRKMKAKIPQRQFLGESALLVRRIERHMYKQVNKEFK